MYNEKEIPFGAFDSELMHQEINIPDGFEATIEGNKIILKKTESENEKARKGIIDYVTLYKDSLVEEEYKSWIAWLEKQGNQKPPMQNGITINGVEYELIKDNEADECERCALRGKCRDSNEVICTQLFDPYAHNRFEKRK